MKKDARQEQRNRNKNKRNTEGVADAIERVLMTGRILRNPLLAGAFA